MSRSFFIVAPHCASRSKRLESAETTPQVGGDAPGDGDDAHWDERANDGEGQGADETVEGLSGSPIRAIAYSLRAGRFGK
jgi:cytochrome c5